MNKKRFSFDVLLPITGTTIISYLKWRYGKGGDFRLRDIDITNVWQPSPSWINILLTFVVLLLLTIFIAVLPRVLRSPSTPPPLKVVVLAVLLLIGIFWIITSLNIVSMLLSGLTLRAILEWILPPSPSEGLSPRAVVFISFASIICLGVCVLYWNG